jgi:hypothetical protein
MLDHPSSNVAGFFSLFAKALLYYYSPLALGSWLQGERGREREREGLVRREIN